MISIERSKNFIRIMVDRWSQHDLWLLEKQKTAQTKLDKLEMSVGGNENVSIYTITQYALNEFVNEFFNKDDTMDASKHWVST